MEYLDKEIWVPVKGYEKSYEVSSHGRIRSLDRFVRSRYSPKPVYGQLLKFQMNLFGYFRVSLSKNGKYKKMFVHRIVANHFCIKNDEKHEVLHKNNIKTDNHYLNLRWDSHMQNIIDSIKDGIKGELPFGWQRPTGKYDISVYRSIYDLYNTGDYTVSKIAKKLSLNRSMVNRALSTYKKHKERINKLVYGT